MKILIVAAYFPPRNIVASYRPYSWAKTWSEEGHEVTVLTSEYPMTKDGLDFDLSKFKVIRIKDAIPGRQTLVSVKEGKISENKISFPKKIKAKIIDVGKKIYVKYIEPTGIIAGSNFPNFWDLWAKRAIKAVKNETFDVVVSTASPYSDHRVGLYLKKHGKTKKWICDWRDLWTKNQFSTGLRIFENYQKKLEKKFHDSADFVITVSEGLKEELQTITDTPIDVIYNGYIKEEFNDIVCKPRRLYSKYTVSYIGTFYPGFQDPEPFFKAVSNLSKMKVISPENFSIQFASAFDDANMLELIRKYELEHFYVFLGKLTHTCALQVEYDSDDILFLDYSNPKVKGILTGKLFECLCLANSVLCIGSSIKTESDKLIEESNSGRCFGKNSELIEKYLLERLKNRNLELEKNLSIIEAFDRQKQAEKLLDLMK